MRYQKKLNTGYKEVAVNIRMTKSLYKMLESSSGECDRSIPDIIRESIRCYCDFAGEAVRNSSLFDTAKAADYQRIIFPNGSDKGILMMHYRAFTDLKRLGPKVNDDVMDFFVKGMSDNSILKRGDFKEWYGKTYMVFHIGATKVWANIGRFQIMILTASRI